MSTASPSRLSRIASVLMAMASALFVLATAVAYGRTGAISLQFIAFAFVTAGASVLFYRLASRRASVRR